MLNFLYCLIKIVIYKPAISISSLLKNLERSYIDHHDDPNKLKNNYFSKLNSSTNFNFINLKTTIMIFLITSTRIDSDILEYFR